MSERCCDEPETCEDCGACLGCVCASKDGNVEGCRGRQNEALRSRIAQLEAVMEAADKLTDRLAGSCFEYVTTHGRARLDELTMLLRSYDAAKAELARVKGE